MPSISMPVAMLGSAGISAAGSLIGGSQASGAANKAAETQLHMYDTTRNDLMPYNAGGQQDFTAYNKLISGSPSQMQASLEALPGYQFTKTQGLKAVQNSAAARGLGVSGASYKGAAGFATGLADTTFDEQANRLLRGASLGENAAAQTGNTGATLAGAAGNAQIAAGQAAAAGTTGLTNNLGQGLLGYGMYGGRGGGTPFVYGGAGSGMDPAFADLPPT